MDGLSERCGIVPQPPQHRLLGHGCRFVFQQTDMGEKALLFHQDIQALLVVPRHNHVDFPVSVFLSHRVGLRPPI